MSINGVFLSLSLIVIWGVVLFFFIRSQQRLVATCKSRNKLLLETFETRRKMLEDFVARRKMLKDN